MKSKVKKKKSEESTHYYFGMNKDKTKEGRTRQLTRANKGGVANLLEGKVAHLKQ